MPSLRAAADDQGAVAGADNLRWAERWDGKTMAEDVTMGELARRLDSLEKRIDSQFGQVGRQLENLQFVHRDTYTVQMTSVIDRIESLEESKAWFARGLVTSIIFPVIVAIILALVLTQ